MGRSTGLFEAPVEASRGAVGWVSGVACRQGFGAGGTAAVCAVSKKLMSAAMFYPAVSGLPLARVLVPNLTWVPCTQQGEVWMKIGYNCLCLTLGWVVQGPMTQVVLV